jgi:phosphoglycerate-specific signal transduction histidine kinase
MRSAVADIAALQQLFAEIDKMLAEVVQNRCTNAQNVYTQLRGDVQFIDWSVHNMILVQDLDQLNRACAQSIFS